MAKEIEIPEGYEARIKGSKVVFVPKESEDERIKEKLHEVICRSINDPNLPYEERVYISKSVLTYVENLEKQKEQKPAPKFNIGDKVEYHGDIYEITDVEIRNNGPFYSVCVINTPIDIEEVKTGIGPGGEKDMVKVEQKPTERINITKMVAKYRVTDEYVEGEYKGKPVNCMIRAYEQGIRDTLLKVKEQKPEEWNYDNRIQYDSIKSGIKAFASTYSFNIESRLFSQLTKEQQQLWREEVEQAAIAGGEYGIELSGDNRYKENRTIEWSEEDEQWLEAIIKDYEDSLTKDKDHATVIKIKIDFLKSLRPQPHWKPSEEQILAIVEALKYIPNNKEEYIILEHLMDDLKSL